ncbi:unnamed protein product [Gordionus sp. m RMFG-2023]
MENEVDIGRANYLHDIDNINWDTHIMIKNRKSDDTGPEITKKQNGMSNGGQKRHRIYSDILSKFDPTCVHDYMRNVGLSTKHGDVPLHSVRAKVFTLNPTNININENWIPLSYGDVTVSFYYDKSRQIYRILSFEDGNILINSVMTPRMSFEILSPLFGKWADFKANALYGLGCLKEEDLERFSNIFNEIMTIICRRVSINGKNFVSRLSQSYHPLLERKTSSDTASSIDIKTSKRKGKSLFDKNETKLFNFRSPQSFRSVQNSPKRYNILGHPLIPLESRLRLENEKLKLAVSLNAESTQKYETEILSLKSRNQDLSFELQNRDSKMLNLEESLKSFKNEYNHLQCHMKDIYLSKNLIKTLKNQMDKIFQQVQNLEDKFNQDFQNFVSYLRLSKLNSKPL